MTPKPLSSHLKRIITALILMPLIFSVLYWGGKIGFFLLVWAAFTVGQWEVLCLLYQRPAFPQGVFYWLQGSLVLWGTYGWGRDGFGAAFLLGLFVGLSRWTAAFENHHRFFEYVGKQMIALAYLPLFLPFFLLIRADREGLPWLFFLLAVTYAGDTGAYYTGRAMGRHKLAAHISPQKTVEGSIGGLTANGLIAWGFGRLFLPHYGALPLVLLGLAVGALGQMGDLLESILKRIARVKDSGRLFPGHGGLLDRVDSLILTAPLVYFFLIFFR